MKNLLPLAALLALGATTLAATADYESDFTKALETAKSGQKMMFILYGREACGICQYTKSLINSRQIKVSPSKFVLADLNCDDPKVAAEFGKRYDRGSFGGTTLPFVVIADSAGQALAKSSGHKDASAWEKLLRDAQKKAGATPAPTAGAKPNWPFKSATPAPGR